MQTCAGTCALLQLARLRCNLFSYHCLQVNNESMSVINHLLSFALPSAISAPGKQAPARPETSFPSALWACKWPQGQASVLQRPTGRLRTQCILIDWMYQHTLMPAVWLSGPSWNPIILEPLGHTSGQAATRLVSCTACCADGPALTRAGLC